MTEPNRAQRAQSYLDMLGIRPRGRRRPAVDIDIGEAQVEPDVEIGDARMEAPDFSGASSDPRAIAASTIARLEAQQPTTQARAATRRGELERDVDRDRRRSEAYARSIIDGLVMDSDNLEGMRRGYTQGMTLGFADEFAGANVAPWDRQAQPRGFREAPRATYASARDEERAANETARAAAPRAYAGAEVYGGLAPALAMPAASGRTALARIAQAGLMGGAFGGVSGLGHAEGDAYDQTQQALNSAGVGAVFGAGGQAVGELGGAVGRYFRGAPEGTPRPGGDFTPEQRTRIDADPELRGQASRRENVELEAAARRVRSAQPSITTADLERIEATHPGGVRGFARDMAEGGVAPRRSLGTPDGVQARAVATERAHAPSPDDVMPPGVQAGRFNDDVTVHPPPSGDVPSMRGRWDDMAPDPHDVHPANPDAIPYDPNDTLEMQMRRAFAEEGRSTGPATRAGTPQRVRVGPRGERPIEFAEGMRAGDTRGRPEAFIDGVEPVIATRQATPQRAPSSLDEEPIDFGMMPAARTGERQLDDVGAARVQANIRAAERRARRGGYSESTHDERTMPVRMSDVEDITPPAPAPRAPMEPPSLPRRRPPAQDVGRWDAPEVAPQASPATPTPGQRVAPELASMRRRDVFDRVTGRTLPGALSTVEDLAVRYLPADSSRAAMGEFRSDAMANEIMRRLSATPATTQFGRALEAAAQRGPRAFGVTLVALVQRHPELRPGIEATAEHMSAEETDPLGGLGTPLEDMDEEDPLGGL